MCACVCVVYKNQMTDNQGKHTRDCTHTRTGESDWAVVSEPCDQKPFHSVLSVSQTTSVCRATHLVGICLSLVFSPSVLLFPLGRPGVNPLLHLVQTTHTLNRAVVAGHQQRASAHVCFTQHIYNNTDKREIYLRLEPVIKRTDKHKLVVFIMKYHTFIMGQWI